MNEGRYASDQVLEVNLRPAPYDVRAQDADSRERHPNPEGLGQAHVEPEQGQDEVVGREVNPEADGYVNPCLDEGLNAALHRWPCSGDG